MKKRVRVRFAPSPTGPLHMGGVRTALYNYLFARRHGGDFLLRIEDTDQTRFVPGAEEYIKESLSWCGITPGEGTGFGDGPHAPYRQSERKALYRRYALELVDRGHAYYAFDTPEELEALRQRLKDEKSAVQQYGPATRGKMKNSLTLPPETVQSLLENGTPYVIRAKMPEDEEVLVRDLIRGEVRLNSSLLDDKVLFKSDGMPTYHLANVVDDHLMEISHVIRGEEWLPSTPLHVLLYRAFGWEQPEFAHLPLLLKPDGKGKLSKRDGDRLGFPVFPLEWTDPQNGEVSSGYREKGFLPEAFVNMLALLGWSPGDDREIMSLQEMSEAFGLEKVQKAGAQYNYEKALWFNQQYLQKESDAGLAARFLDQLRDKGIEAGIAEAAAVARLIRERCILTGDLWEQGWFFFRRPESYDTGLVKKKWDESKRAFFEKALGLFGSADAPWPDAETNTPAARLEARFKELMESEGMKPGEVLLPLRVMLTGGRSGPGVFEIAAQLGREETLDRIRQALPLFG